MKHDITISKNGTGLNRVSCICGFLKLTEIGSEAERASYLHAKDALKNGAPVKVTHVKDGAEVKPSNRKAKPGRSGGTTHRNQ